MIVQQNRMVVCLVMFFAFLMSGCLTRTFQDNAEMAAVIVDKEAKTMKVDWLCTANRNDRSGMNSQEEYCEWTRASRSASGKLQCEFTTNFDSTRPRSLTMNKKNGAPETFANSQYFLGALKNACSNTFGQCGNGDCVCSRKSDPQICAAIGTARKNNCSVDLVASNALTYRTPGAGDQANPLVAVKLIVAPKYLNKYCFYKLPLDASGKEITIAGVDSANERTHVRCFFPQGEEPSITSCDKLADTMKVSIELKLGGSSCDINKVASAIGGRTPNACR